MATVTIPFYFKTPDEYLSTNFSKNKRTYWEYVGDDRLWVSVDIDTNETIIGTTLNEAMINDGRPRPRNIRYVEIDATIDTLVAYIARPPGMTESSTDLGLGNRQKILVCPTVEGYGEYVYFEPMAPLDVYQETLTYNVETKRLEPQVVTIQNLAGIDQELEYTWEYVRQRRNQELRASDKSLSSDMPEEIRTKIITYRQLLRDLPENLKNHTPWQAFNMFPRFPDI
jgi:hypothetical protein